MMGGFKGLILHPREFNKAIATPIKRSEYDKLVAMLKDGEELRTYGEIEIIAD